MRIVLTGGGTSGHVIPFEPIITALRSQFVELQKTLPARLGPSSLQLTFVGVSNKKTRDFFAHYDVPTIHIPSGKLRRYASALTIIDLLFRLPVGMVLALLRMYWLMPDLVVSKGGYGSLPVVLAAAFYRIPILLHESDATPGLANTFLMRFAAAVTLGFAAAKDRLPKQWQYKAIVTGTPIRSAILSAAGQASRQALGIEAQEKVLLVMGGSQGAQQINEVVLQLLPTLVLAYTVIHLTGEDHFESVKAVAEELLGQSSRAAAYKPFAYLTDNMPAALAAADGVVSRAGSSVAELIALKKPMLLIPLDGAAGDHQRANAQALEAAGAAIVLDPTNLGVALFEQNIERLMNDQSLRAHLIANMQMISSSRAAQDIAQLGYTLAQGVEPTNA